MAIGEYTVTMTKSKTTERTPKLMNFFISTSPGWPIPVEMIYLATYSFLVFWRSVQKENIGKGSKHQIGKDSKIGTVKKMHLGFLQNKELVR